MTKLLKENEDFTRQEADAFMVPIGGILIWGVDTPP